VKTKISLGTKLVASVGILLAQILIITIMALTSIGLLSRDLHRAVSNVIALTTGAETTAAAAGGSRTSQARMETTIQHLLEASNGISSKLTALSEKAGNISAVVTTISKVADQTNLLSLNAAIEALRPTLWRDGGMINKEKSRERCEIRRILMGEWDPIGVSDTPEASDEYGLYIDGVYELLERGTSDATIYA
jgi:hypothetical protein